ncbi:unnamed protein product [Rhizoctonia solani]|uniref:Uncharacterized protein n=1 Tax=Rhizoctonia solani TaxID=456999 RepID=A0A8H3H5K4_9AGAM|nr:unnamed protein product [Rhizoctonia solani]
MLEIPSSLAQQPADSSASSSSVFDTTPQYHNYQTHPTGFCVFPALARDTGLPQRQEQLSMQPAIQLCPEAKTITVLAKKLQAQSSSAERRRSDNSSSDHRPFSSFTTKLSDSPQTKPRPPRPVTALSDTGRPFKNEIAPPVSELLPSTQASCTSRPTSAGARIPTGACASTWIKTSHSVVV